MEELSGGLRQFEEERKRLEKACLFENRIENMEDYVDKVKNIQKASSSFLSFVDREYPVCPICNKYYYLKDYKIKIMENIKKVSNERTSMLYKEECVYAVCPQGHDIRLGNNDILQYKEDEEMNWSQWKWVGNIINERNKEWK